MKKQALIGIFIILMQLVGCSNEAAIEIEPVSAPMYEKEVEVYLPDDIVLGSYEPLSGVYLGAYTESNSELNYSIENYESILEKEQAFRVFQYKEKGDITSTTFLQCLANGQTPYIKVLGSEDGDLTPIYELVGDLNTIFKMPVFIELFPVYGEKMTPDTYKAYYNEAYTLINKYLDDVTIVWSVEWNHMDTMSFYYPGDERVDWIGLNVSLPKYKDGVAYTPDVEEQIDFWYKTYQEEKPLLLSTLALSHFSKVDHTYTIEDVKNKLNFFYGEMIESYPRIKGILYADVAMDEVSPVGTDDYRITNQEKLSSYVAELIQPDIFLSELIETEVRSTKFPVMYTVVAMESEDELYVDQKQLELFKDKDIVLRKVPTLIDDEGTKYYQLASLLEQAGGYLEG